MKITQECIFFQKNAGLRALRLNGNKIGNRGGMFFAQMLQINTTLEALDLGDTDLVTSVTASLLYIIVVIFACQKVHRPEIFCFIIF